MSFDLYLITDPAADVIGVTRAALSAAEPGRVAVQLRDKSASARELIALASALLPICRAAGAPLFVNDRADVARIVGADGAHLPEAGLSVQEARTILGPSARIGRSCHDRAGLERALRDGADLATLAPVNAVPGKGAPLGVEGFARAARDLPLDVYALGGVGAEDARALREAGARGVAVIRAVYGAVDPAAEVRALLSALR